MFVGVEPETQSLILEYYGVDAEATEACQSLASTGLDERTARSRIQGGRVKRANQISGTLRV